MPHYPKALHYSKPIEDDEFEYQNAHLPREIFEKMPRKRILSRNELIALGINLPGPWEHFHVFNNEPSVLMLRKRKGVK